MISNFSRVLRQIFLISNPRLWAYAAGTYLLGVALALAFFRNMPVEISPWFFVLSLFWIISVGMIMGFSHFQDESKLVFPWELPFFFRRFLKRDKTAVTTTLDTDTKISVIIGGISAILFILVNLVLLSAKIFALGISLLIVDFLHNSRRIEGRYIPFADLVFGATYLIPLLVGYVFITDKWPSAPLLLAGFLFFASTELYGKVVESEDDFKKNKKTSAIVLGDKKSLILSVFLAVLCGTILASYEVFNFLFIVPFLVILTKSFFAKDRNSLLKIHSKTLIVHSVTGFLATSYFFIISSL